MIRYAVIINQAGYLPDNEPEYYDTFIDARDALAADMNVIAEGMEYAEEDGADALSEAADEVYTWTGPDVVSVHGWAYEIQAIDWDVDELDGEAAYENHLEWKESRYDGYCE